MRTKNARQTRAERIASLQAEESRAIAAARAACPPADRLAALPVPAGDLLRKIIGEAKLAIRRLAQELNGGQSTDRNTLRRLAPLTEAINVINRGQEVRECRGPTPRSGAGERRNTPASEKFAGNGTR